jgi:hypothetical protein
MTYLEAISSIELQFSWSVPNPSWKLQEHKHNCFDTIAPTENGIFRVLSNHFCTLDEQRHGFLETTAQAVSYHLRIDAMHCMAHPNLPG